MTEPPEFRPNFLFVQVRARLKDFFITSLWLSLMLAVLTGWWGVEGDALMLHLAAIFAVLFLCLFISFIVVCIVRKRHPIAELRQLVSFKSVLYFGLSLIFFVLLGAVAVVLSTKK
ncbi:hypothetical protein SBC1_40620 (plasmid) [Caballeronia sp. SBC1]|nr:hypothetical protein SBC2_47320 [Caballeronia sp. SBC2]QIN64022.1 hypothetical protein SBC1_40620 [Caballeronia sp. SBC1]